MSSRAFATWSAAALVVVLTSTNPVYRGLVLLVALNVLVALRRPDARLRPMFIAVGVAAVLAALLNAALSHTGQHVLFTVPEQLPGIGGPVTVEAALYGADVALGIAAAVLAIAPLSRVLHPHDLVDAFPASLQRTAALTGAALNLVPAMARNAVAINEAQRMRGSSGARLRDWHAVAAPVVLSALDDSLQLAEAMDARGFGSGPRTHYLASRVGLSGAAVITSALAAVVLTIAARVAGALPDWYPFPVATVPPVTTVGVVACLLLAVPVVAWHRS
ncbi:MAG TPA: energy-coupling factor transporter transmembrane component T [Candidatus Dormibacteraeota bacterium]